MPDLLELLPCPFCGSRPHACWGDKPNEDGNYTVECSSEKCQATFWHCQSSPTEAIAAWNTRTPSAESHRMAAEEIANTIMDTLRDQLGASAPPADRTNFANEIAAIIARHSPPGGAEEENK